MVGCFGVEFMDVIEVGGFEGGVLITEVGVGFIERVGAFRREYGCSICVVSEESRHFDKRTIIEGDVRSVEDEVVVDDRVIHECWSLLTTGIGNVAI